MSRIALLASGRGTTMEAVVGACRDGRLNATPTLMITTNLESGAAGRARALGLPCYDSIYALLPYGVEWLVLCGYLRQLSPEMVALYRNRIVNIHPSLLPKYGGRGFYGLRVHEAVLEAGDHLTGATVHLVDEGLDTGPILAQRTIPVLEGDTPQTLADRLRPVEHALYIDTLEQLL